MLGPGSETVKIKVRSVSRSESPTPCCQRFKGPEMARGLERAQAKPEVTQQRVALSTVGAAALDSRWERIGGPLRVVGLAGAP